jgi:hypothetical protein
VLSPAKKDLGTPKLWSPAGKGKGKGSKDKAHAHTTAQQEAAPAIEGLEDNGDDLAFKSGKVDVGGICEAKVRISELHQTTGRSNKQGT